MTKGTIPTPELDKLRAARPKTEAIQAFLEFMHEKGYQLKKTVPAGWCAPDGSRRITNEEFDESGLERLSDVQLYAAQCDPSDRVAFDQDGQRAWRMAGHDRNQLCRVVIDYGWRWDRGLELDDVGFEGHSLDKHLYEFIEVDPQKIDDERRMLLEGTNPS